MNLIKPFYEIIEQGTTLDDVLMHITKAGYICYKTEKEITPTSAKKFVDNLIKSGHTSVLEHGTIYLGFLMNQGEARYYKYIGSPYSKITYKTLKKHKYIGVTTNYRVLYENGWLDDLEHICKPTKHHNKRITVKFITSIGIVRELIRHRAFSFSNESTRYCNYSADKFGNELTFIIPSWVDTNYFNNEELKHFNKWIETDDIIRGNLRQEFHFANSLFESEQNYFKLLEKGLKPEQAREVLPLCTKSELIMTGYVDDWKHFCELRSSIAKTGKPHPDMEALITPLTKEFVSRGYFDIKL